MYVRIGCRLFCFHPLPSIHWNGDYAALGDQQRSFSGASRIRKCLGAVVRVYAIREFSFTVDFSTVFSQLKINHTLSVCTWYSSVKRLGQLVQEKRQRCFLACNKQTGPESKLRMFRPQFDDLIVDGGPNIDNCVGPTSQINMEGGENAELDGKMGPITWLSRRFGSEKVRAF